MIRKVQRVFDAVDRLRGRKSVSMTVQAVDTASHYTVTTNRGFEIKIFCLEQDYGVKHSALWHWWHHSTRQYVVYCECDAYMPDAFKTILGHRLTIPDLTFAFTSEPYKKKIAIMAYLDVLLKNIKS
jgi:hypothetical protein